jgi:hypothetical protein
MCRVGCLEARGSGGREGAASEPTRNEQARWQMGAGMRVRAWPWALAAMRPLPMSFPPLLPHPPSIPARRQAGTMFYGKVKQGQKLTCPGFNKADTDAAGANSISMMGTLGQVGGLRKQGHSPLRLGAVRGRRVLCCPRCASRGCAEPATKGAPSMLTVASMPPCLQRPHTPAPPPSPRLPPSAWGPTTTARRATWTLTISRSS